MDTAANWIVITGPTASGKTSLAVAVAQRVNGEILSADSRQVYRRLNIGTGKDLDEYTRDGKPTAYHLIDVINPGTEYHIAQYLKDANAAIERIEAKGRVPVICGGSGLYVQALLEQPAYVHVPIDPELRAILSEQGKDVLIERYRQSAPLSFAVDEKSSKRLIRAIEIQEYLKQHDTPIPEIEPHRHIPIFLLTHEREQRRIRISERLQARIDEGLIDEVEELRKSISDEALIRLGLEYKFITQYLRGDYSKTEMTRLLETAIHQFAKRQMTWFRRMERQGYNVIILPHEDGEDAMVDFILKHR